MAEYVGCDFRVSWCAQHWLPTSGYDLADIFADLDSLRWDKDESGTLYEHEHTSPGMALEVESRLRAGQTVRLKSSCFIRPEMMTDEEFKENIHLQFARLKPAPKVIGRVPSFPHNTVGIQIRRGDHWRATRYSPLGLFFRIMDRHLARSPDVYFYVATDSPTVQETLKKRYGSRIVTAMPMTPASTPSDQAREALADMLALARTRVIYHSAMSSFGYVAHLMSRCPLRCISKPGVPAQWNDAEMDRNHDIWMVWNWEQNRWSCRKRPEATLRENMHAWVMWARTQLVCSDVCQRWPFHASDVIE